MEWIHILDYHVLWKKSSDIEEYRQDLDKVQSKCVPLLLEKESSDVIEAATYCIFQLEKEELRSHNNKRLSYWRTSDTHSSKGSPSLQISLLKMKVLTELAKKEEELKYTKLEIKKVEMERKKHKIKEFQPLKSYESAIVEANSVARL